MAVLPIVTYNDPVLREKTKPITEFSEETRKFIADLFETMYNSEGVGLAAPQVGKSLQVFVIDADNMMDEDEELPGPMAFINPKIIEKKGRQIPMDEGCLSIPDVTDKVLRPETIVINYKDENFKDQTLEATRWLARVIQHEYDHLQGILFIDYLSAFKKRMHKADLKEIDEGLRETKYPILPKS
ncbi:MAG: peptide deformylase [Balneolaceae bacterium]